MRKSVFFAKGDLFVPRSGLLDGLRGSFLLFMTLSHMVLQGGFFLQNFHFRQLMFTESAQGFIFLSGLLAGMVQGARYLKKGESAMRKSLLSRMLELWIYTTGLVALAWIARDTLPGGTLAWKNWLGFSGFEDPLRLIAVASFLFQPTFADILPQYVVYLGAGILVIPLVLKGRWLLVMTVSVLLWTVAQLGINGLLSGPLDTLIKAGDGQGLRAAFDVFAWQILFVSGMVFGALSAAGRIDWTKIFRPDRLEVPAAALLVVLFFAPLRIATAHGLLPVEVLKPFSSMEIRSNLGPVYVLNFLGIATLVSWLLIAGKSCAISWVARISGGLRLLFSLAPLRLLGRHSLQVYTWHVVLVYAARYSDARWGLEGELQKTALALCSFGLLFLPALWRERGNFLREKTRNHSPA